DVGNYLTGSILTETIFSWPGVGRYVLLAIQKRDLPAVQGSILFFSVIFVLVNLLTDVLYAKADPLIAYDYRGDLPPGPKPQRWGRLVSYVRHAPHRPG